MIDFTDAYKMAVRNNFSFLKQTTKLDDLFAKSIILKNGEGYLVPVCELHTTDNNLIQLLAKWRDKNSFAYPTQFPVTIDGTAKWLRSKLLDIEDRILFLVLDKYSNRIGHLGFANAINDDCEMEVDNVVRGESLNAGIMSIAMEALLNWADEMIAPKSVILKVFGDNEHAIRFYEKLGFHKTQSIPLQRHTDGQIISYTTLNENDKATPDKYFLKMDYASQKTENGSKMILTAGPSVSAREISYVLNAARSGWNEKWNLYIKQFEARFAEYIGVDYAVSTACCTGALHLALLALGIGAGDEVIVPDITWVATANAVVYTGATPVFADIEPDSWCLDPDSFKEKITVRTKAVIPVHLYGHPARMDRIVDIARAHNLYIVEDAAPAIGAEFDGKKTGTFGDFAAFSFQGAKLVVSGEGGMLVTNNRELYEKVCKLWDQGRVPGTFWIDQLGWKYKMSNLQAAFGLAQLERLNELISTKRRIFSWYAEGLKAVAGIRLNYETPMSHSIYWMCSLMLDKKLGITRDDLCAELKKRNIDTRPVFPTISQYPIWPVKQKSLPVASQVAAQSLNLPSGVCLRWEQIDYICRNIKEILSSVK